MTVINRCTVCTNLFLADDENIQVCNACWGWVTSGLLEEIEKEDK